MKNLILFFLLAIFSSYGFSQATIEPVVPDEELVFWCIEEQPSFPGGEEAMFKFIQSNIIYPALAKEANIMGKVILEFTIGKDGWAHNVKVLRGIGGGCDEEAVRVIKKMPAWHPGKQNGRPIPVRYRLPINFVLR